MARPIPELPKSEKTRAHILNVAAEEYRQHGLDGVSVRDIMQRAGLTQGGFYFHFSDKDALFWEAIRTAVAASEKIYANVLESAPAGKELHAFINFYLSPGHRDHPSVGCLMAALASDVARRERTFRKDFTDIIFKLQDRVAPYVVGRTATERRRQAGLLLSAMAGVLMVARVHRDSATSNDLLAQGRKLFSGSFARK